MARSSSWVTEAGERMEALQRANTDTGKTGCNETEYTRNMNRGRVLCIYRIQRVCWRMMYCRMEPKLKQEGW